MSKKIILTEDLILEKINKFLMECDADDLARICGEIFGGKCFVSQEISDESTYSGSFLYDFVPDKNYYGAFD